MTYILALDQGTTSSRSILFEAESARIIALAQKELTQIFPKPGWVEHDPMEIWRTQLDTAQEALAKAGVAARDVRAIGITNQRETTVLWHRKTGLPVYNAIVWQDRRGEPTCAMLRDQGKQTMIQERTGLLVDAYFSATKLRWLLDQVPQARAQAEAGELAFGTVDSWLLWQLTGGRVHATDVSNASRTMLFDIHSNEWSQPLLDQLDIPARVLPAVHRSSDVFAETESAHFGSAIAIGGMAGDQQSALFGQACFGEGMVKNTYGTGCFMLMHTGARCQTSRNRLLSTRAAQTNHQSRFAIEGSVFIGGAVIQWLRDGLQAIRASHEVQALAASVADTGGVMLVPAFTGLGAPYWQPEARGIITGLTRGTTLAHIARAALESIAYQSAALLRAMSQDAQANQQHPIRELRVDGGACVNDLLMQMQADLLGVPVVRPKITETTALGAAYLAGLATGVYRDTEELSSLWNAERTFFPTLAADRVAEMMSRWEMAVQKSRMES